LERLADINPDLLENIKKTAQDVLSSGQSATGTSSQIATIVETRSPEWMARSKEWGNVSLDNSHDLITKLQKYVQSSSPETTYTQTDAIQMQSVLAAASTTASLLTNALQRLKEHEEDKERISRPRKTMRHSVQIDKALFTNEGVKTKDETIIGSLYQVGLPFVSTADGKRFATQTELSKHLDFLFKKKYVHVVHHNFSRHFVCTKRVVLLSLSQSIGKVHGEDRRTWVVCRWRSVDG
jgi:pre-mRNA cleavage complex 2 protein Pcf11